MQEDSVDISRQQTKNVKESLREHFGYVITGCDSARKRALVFPRWRRSLGEKAEARAFRHGLATELAEACIPITVLQQHISHADVKTTLRVYAHAIPESQRDAMERASIGTATGFGKVRRS